MEYGVSQENEVKALVREYARYIAAIENSFFVTEL